MARCKEWNDNGIYPVQPTWTLQFVGVGRPLSLSELVIIGRKRAYGFEMTVILCVILSCIEPQGHVQPLEKGENS